MFTESYSVTRELAGHVRGWIGNRMGTHYNGEPLRSHPVVEALRDCVYQPNARELLTEGPESFSATAVRNFMNKQLSPNMTQIVGYAASHWGRRIAALNQSVQAVEPSEMRALQNYISNTGYRFRDDMRNILDAAYQRTHPAAERSMALAK